MGAGAAGWLGTAGHVAPMSHLDAVALAANDNRISTRAPTPQQGRAMPPHRCWWGYRAPAALPPAWTRMRPCICAWAKPRVCTCTPASQGAAPADNPRSATGHTLQRATVVVVGCEIMAGSGRARTATRIPPRGQRRRRRAQHGGMGRWYWRGKPTAHGMQRCAGDSEAGDGGTLKLRHCRQP